MARTNSISVRTLLISDVHLGCKHAQTNECLHFLQTHSPEQVFIAGDFIDAWKINSGWHWSKACDEIIAHIADWARTGTRIHYVPGNHDAFLRDQNLRALFPSGLREVEIEDEFVLETLRGWRFLVTHGDRFDVFETHAQWISKQSSMFYDACLSLNWCFAQLALAKRKNPYQACAVVKDRVKRAIRFISNFESKLSQHAASQGCHGVICGHIHTPDVVYSESMLYCNTGDWIENCTGIVEHHNGSIQLVSRYGQDRTLQLPDLHSLSNHASFGADGSNEIDFDRDPLEQTCDATARVA